jgi:hypothetical protein
MKKIFIISLLLFFFLITPVSAELFSEMNQKVFTYNQNIDKVPDFMKDLLGNEEIYGIIDLNDGNTLEVKAITKDGRVIEFSKLGTKIASDKGDCNGDNKLTALDALCALQMSVGKIEENENIDVDGNGEVSSLDAKIILQNAVGLSSEVDPTIIVKTNENTMDNIMNSQKPVDVFMDAYDSGDITIDGVGFGKSITLSIGKLVIKVSQILGIL